MQSPSRIGTNNWEKPLWSQTSWIPRKNIFTRRNLTTSPENFLDKLRFPKSKKVLPPYLGFVNYYTNNIPRMTEKLNPFYKLLKTEVPINITSELKEISESVNKALSDACVTPFQEHSIPGKQLVLMTNASFRIGGYSLRTEHNPDQ